MRQLVLIILHFSLMKAYAALLRFVKLYRIATGKIPIIGVTGFRSRSGARARARPDRRGRRDWTPGVNRDIDSHAQLARKARLTKTSKYR